MNLHNAEFIRSVTSVSDCPKDGLVQIAFAGKSNVGKSSVINKLLLRKNFARVGQAPGKTTHINFFCIDKKLYLVDLPGYGYAKVSVQEKERWGKLMEAYFRAEGTLDYGVMIVDARHKPTANDVTMADFFLQSGKPFIVVANKLDKLKTSPASAKRLLFRRASRSSPSLQKRATDANSFSRLFSKPQAS